MNDQKCIELDVGLPDRGVMLKMERCAEFLARMIENTGGRFWRQLKPGVRRKKNREQ